jgi:sec-independent protein translocase protein TatC
MSHLNLENSFWHHLEALRSTLIGSLLILAAGVTLCFCFYQEIFAWITAPLQQSRLVEASGGMLHHQELKRERLLNSGPHEVIYKAAFAVQPSPAVRTLDKDTYAIPPGAFLDIDRLQSGHELVLFGPTEGMLTAFKVCLWLGLLISSPFWAALLLRFILPALYPHEKRWILLFFGGTLIAMIAGIAFAQYVTIPIANRYLELFNASIGRNLWSLAHYLDYTFMLMIASGFAFEMGLALFLLVHMGLLTAEGMVAKRRHMIVVAFILGALLTPPDVPTQLMLAFPLIGLYELAICYAKIKGRARELDRSDHVHPG